MFCGLQSEQRRSSMFSRGLTSRKTFQKCPGNSLSWIGRTLHPTGMISVPLQAVWHDLSICTSCSRVLHASQCCVRLGFWQPLPSTYILETAVSYSCMSWTVCSNCTLYGFASASLFWFCGRHSKTYFKTWWKSAFSIQWPQACPCIEISVISHT